MKTLRNLIRETIQLSLKEAAERTTDEALNAALGELLNIGQEAKIAAQATMGFDPTGYFMYFDEGQIGSGFLPGMAYKGTGRTKRVVKMRELPDGREIPFMIKIDQKDELTGETAYDEDGNPLKKDMTVKETVPMDSTSVFSEPLHKANFYIPFLKVSFDFYGTPSVISYMDSLSLFRLRENSKIDKGVFIYTHWMTPNTPQYIGKSEVFGAGSQLEKAMVALGKYAGIIPSDYDHDGLIERLKLIYEKTERQRSSEREAERARQEAERSAEREAEVESEYERIMRELGID